MQGDEEFERVLGVRISNASFDLFLDLGLSLLPMAGEA